MITKSEFDRITALLQSGQTKQALKLCKTGMKRHPKEPAFPHLAGTALSQAGNPREGAQYFMKALKLAPGNKASQDNLATALVQSGQTDKARTYLHKLLRERKVTAPLHYQLAALEFQSRNPDATLEAVTACITALEGNTDPAGRSLLACAYGLRGTHHQLNWDNAAAQQDFRAALDLGPDNPEIMAKYAASLSVEMQADTVMEVLEKALSLTPHNPAVLMQYAIALLQVGRRDDAAGVLSSVLERDPHHVEALTHMVTALPADAASALAGQVKSAFQKAAKGSYDQGQLAFALARALERAGSVEAAKTWFATGNRIVAALRPYDAEAADEKFAATTALFPVGSQLPHAAVSDGPVPVFVIGQPRSGTTLTELVLSAHPRIAGVGEQTTAMIHAQPFVTDKVPYGPAEAEQFAADYRAELPDLPADTTHVVDKMPGNYTCVGFLLTAFPNAVILNICRDPRDVAWSMWRSDFGALALNYTFDMAAMAREANLYARYIRHWSDLFPGRVNDIAYQDVVADITGQSKRLASLCGVDWHPDMAAPERNSAPVRTASSLQVREGVHSRSVGGWARHAGELAPFIERLDPDLWPDIT